MADYRPTWETPIAQSGTIGWQPDLNLVTKANSSTASDYASGDFNSLLSSLQKRASEGDISAEEKLFNYYATKESEKTARDWTAKREDFAYSRLVQDLERAGISPYVMSSASPVVSGSSGASYSSSQMTSQANSERSSKTDLSEVIFKLVGTALMYALFFA